MKTILLILAAILLTAVTASAQVTAAPGQHLGFDVTQSVGVATSFGYNIYVDNAAPVPATSLVCTPITTGATCSVDIPAMTAGLHVVTMTQTGAGLESAKSAALSFQFVVIVTPGNLRIVSIAELLGLRSAQ